MDWEKAPKAAVTQCAQVSSKMRIVCGPASVCKSACGLGAADCAESDTSKLNRKSTRTKLDRLRRCAWQGGASCVAGKMADLACC